MNTLLVIIVIFILSLSGAAILFKFFKSSALVKSKKYRAGGAIAGFIIIYSVLYASYYNIQKSKYHQIIDQYNQYEELLTTRALKGKMDPVVRHTEIVLASEEFEPDSEGNLVLRYMPAIAEEGNVITIYVLGESGWVKKYVDPDTVRRQGGVRISLENAIQHINE